MNRKMKPDSEIMPVYSIFEFRHRFEMGDLAYNDKFSISFDEVTGLSANPLSDEYAKTVMDLWKAISGRTEYCPGRDEMFSVDLKMHYAKPWPFASSNPTVVSQYFGAVAILVGQLGVQPPASVIEYGTGWGHLAMTLAATGYQVEAVDLNPTLIKLLKRKSRAQGVTLKAVHSSFLDYLPDQLVDAIVFFESFHHCDQPFKLLDRCVSQLLPNGRILFLADAIYDNFYAPWGVRLDAQASFITAEQGWLELGFQRGFLTEQLISRGLHVSWQTFPWLGVYGTLLIATKKGK